ncbi:MAG: hypothetical protein NC212_06635 [Staphylococcus sp.]|nr:hypothetical protein [Staphylococcus sp.]
MNRIFEISDIEELREYLLSCGDKEILRGQLLDAFQRYSHYRNASEWNLAVRVCEALAIVGWGSHKPVEAIRGAYFNGNPDTCFLDRNAKPCYLDAVWSKRKDGVAIDYTRSFSHENSGSGRLMSELIGIQVGEVQDIKLDTQRNWIPKNPIRIVRGLANCYSGSRPVVKSIDNFLMPALNACMRPEMYGSDIDIIIFNLSFSFYDNYHCKTNHIIADESLKLRHKDFYPKLLEMYSLKEIEDNGYYLRNRFTYGPFRKETGNVRVDIVFEKEFSQKTVSVQKELLSGYLIHAAQHLAKRLHRKINYDFPLMIADFKSVLETWAEGTTDKF